MAVGEARAAVARGQRVGQMPQQRQQQRREIRGARRPGGFRPIGGEFGERLQLDAGRQTVPQRLFGAFDRADGEGAEEAAVENDAAGHELFKAERDADRRGAAPAGHGSAGEFRGGKRAPRRQQFRGRGAVERLGGEERQRLAQGAECQAQKLPRAFAGDAELEADVA